MVKITFEINEDLINKTADLNALDKVDNGAYGIMCSISDCISATVLKRRIEEGKKDFTLNTGKMDEQERRIFGHIVGFIFALAAFSDTANKEA